MSLSDFMPYGAPELLEGASPRMARSTLTASAVVAALVWGLGLVAASRPALRTVEQDTGPEYTFEQRIYEPERPTEPERMIPKVTPKDGELRPVEVEPPAPSILEPERIGPGPAVKGGEPDAVGDRGVAPAPPVDPLPGVFVYTDELPQLVRGVKPLYPDLAREAGVEGTVKLQLLIGLDGRVQRAIVRPGGSVPMLDEAAIAAALQCVFTPALVNNRPVKVWVNQDYRFSLH